MRAGLLLTYFNNRSVLSANGFKSMPDLKKEVKSMAGKRF